MKTYVVLLCFVCHLSHNIRYTIFHYAVLLTPIFLYFGEVHISDLQMRDAEPKNVTKNIYFS